MENQNFKALLRNARRDLIPSTPLTPAQLTEVVQCQQLLATGFQFKLQLELETFSHAFKALNSQVQVAAKSCSEAVAQLVHNHAAAKQCLADIAKQQAVEEPNFLGIQKFSKPAVIKRIAELGFVGPEFVEAQIQEATSEAEVQQVIANTRKQGLPQLRQ